MIHNWNPQTMMERTLLVANAESVSPTKRRGNDDDGLDRGADEFSVEGSSEHGIRSWGPRSG